MPSGSFLDGSVLVRREAMAENSPAWGSPGSIQIPPSCTVRMAWKRVVGDTPLST